MKNKTKEDAYLEMLKPAETITVKAQNYADNLAAIKESPGDGFFIRYTEYLSNHCKYCAFVCKNIYALERF